MPTTWKGKAPGWESPPTSGAALTPADADFSNGVIYRALWVGTGGTVVVRFADDSTDVTLTKVPDGTLLVGAVKRLALTGTTASAIVGLR